MKQIYFSIAISLIIFTMIKCSESNSISSDNSNDIILSIEPVFIDNNDTFKILINKAKLKYQNFSIFIDDIEINPLDNKIENDNIIITGILPQGARAGQIKLVQDNSNIIATQFFKIVHIEGIAFDSLKKDLINIIGWGFRFLNNPKLSFDSLQLEIIQFNDSIITCKMNENVRLSGIITLKSIDYQITKKVQLLSLPNIQELYISFGNITFFRNITEEYYDWPNRGRSVSYDTIITGYSYDSKEGTFPCTTSVKVNDIVFDNDTPIGRIIITARFEQTQFRVFGFINKTLSAGNNGVTEYFIWTFDIKNLPINIVDNTITVYLTGDSIKNNLEILNYSYYLNYGTSSRHNWTTSINSTGSLISDTSFITLTLK